MTTLDLGKLRFHLAGEWDEAALYEPNDVVKYGGNAYCYIFALKQAGIVPNTDTHWALLVEGVKFVGTYDSAHAYHVGELAAYGGKVFKAAQDTTGFAPSNATYWSLFVDGISPKGVYSAEQGYVAGDVVAYGAILYIAKHETTGNAPDNPTHWDVWAVGLQNRGAHTTATVYYQNDIVTHGGNSYACKATHASTTFAADLAAGKWEPFSSGIRWREAWATATSYLVDDLVRFGASTYRATATHASTTFATDLAGGKWEFLAQGAEFAVPDPTTAPNGHAVVVQNGAFVLGEVAIKTLVVTASTALVANTIYALDSTAGSFSLTLPASPAVGDTVRLFDAGGNLSGLPITVLCNSQRINALADDLLMDADGADITLTFINATIGWKVH